MRTPSGLNGGCAVGGWMLTVPAGPFRGKPLERGGEWCRCFSRRKNAGPFGTISLSGGPTEGTRWRTRLKIHSLHWILCSHNNTFHRSCRAARLFDRQLTHCGPVNVSVRRIKCAHSLVTFFADLACAIPWLQRNGNGYCGIDFQTTKHFKPRIR